MINLRYEDIFVSTLKLITQIHEKDIFRPIVAPILRGGKYPGDIIASLYGVDPLPITYTTRHGDKKDNLDDWCCMVLSRANSHPIILVDDLIDSGETLIAINEKLVEYGIDVVYNCVLYRKISSPTIPNLIFGEEIADEWLQFPWETNV